MSHRFVLSVELPAGHFAQAKALAALEPVIAEIEKALGKSVTHTVEEVKPPRKPRAARAA